MKLQLSNYDSIEARKESNSSVAIKILRTGQDTYSMLAHLDKTELSAFIAGLQQLHKQMS